MRIFLVAPITDYVETLGGFCLRGFQELGHEVRFWDYRRFPTCPVTFDSPQEDIDCTFVIKGAELPDKAWELFQRFGPVAVWYPDAIEPLESHFTYVQRLVDNSDFFFLGMHHPKEIMERYNAQILPFGYDPATHYTFKPLKGADNPRWKTDLCFVGTGHSTRLGFIYQMTKYEGLGVWGNGWVDSEYTAVIPFKDYQYRGPAIYGPDKMNAYHNTKIVLNHHHCDYGPNMRVFEALASGAFLLGDNPLGLDSEFTLGADLIANSVIATLHGNIAYYLDHPDERQKIAEHGHKTVKKYTYAYRMESMLKRIGV